MIDAAIARVLVEASLRVCLVALAVAAVLKFARIESSAVRHAAWTSVVVAMLLMPFLPYVVPTIELPGRSRTAAALASAPDQLPIIGDVSLQQPVRSLTVEPTGPAPSGAPSAPLFMSAPAARVTSVPRWLVAAIVIYAAGVLMLIARWVLAARFLSKLKRHSTPIATSATVDCYESPLVATPITVGALSPRIVLPTEWKTWSAAKLAGVLAHEHAHVLRRDPLIALVAYVNRCIFWFHPLAWWLERKLAATAEDAADEAGARAMSDRREYAQVLVDMATVVREHGGRVAWQGVGVDGNGLLGRSIDRLLSGEVLREVSTTKKALVAAVSVVAVAAAVACRTRVEPPPLKPNAEIVKAQADSKARGDRWKQARAMSRSEVAALHERVKLNPDDVDALETLLVYYSPNWDKPWPDDRLERIAARRPLVLLAIERHAEKTFAGDYGARIYPSDTDPLADPAGYAHAKALWLKKAETPGVSVAALQNAARFFEAYSPKDAEKMLLKAQRLQPGAVSGQLGRLYGMVITGSYGSTPLNVLRMIDEAHRKSPVALAMRASLDTSTDARVLLGACTFLTRSAGQSFPEARGLGRSYCERAAALAPGDSTVTTALRSLLETERHTQIYGHLRKIKHDASVASLRQSLSEVPTEDRLEATIVLAERVYEFGRDNRKLFPSARELANDALALAKTDGDAQARGRAVYQANLIFGAIAVLEGHRDEAVRWMAAAAEAPPSGVRQYERGAETDLTNYLLKAGERETVAAFFEKASRRLDPPDPGMVESAAAIRAGTMPRMYQYYFQTNLNSDGSEKK